MPAEAAAAHRLELRELAPHIRKERAFAPLGDPLAPRALEVHMSTRLMGIEWKFIKAYGEFIIAEGICSRLP